MQDEQVDWLKSMHKSGMHVLWKAPEGDFQAVIGFSSQRPHIMFVATETSLNQENTPPQKKDSIVEMDVRKLFIKDFTVLHKVEIPVELRDPVFMNL
jgi:hypothetical protein